MSGPVLLVTGLAAVAGALVLAVLAAVRTGPERTGVSRSLAAIEELYGRTAKPERGGGSGGEGPGALARGMGRLSARLSPVGVEESLVRRLDLAGNPAGWTPERILALKGAGLLLGALLGGLLGRSGVALAVVLALGAGALGFFLPDLLLYNTTLKRQEEVRRSLPDVLDMMTVCVQAGLGFDAALAQVARNSAGPLAAECARLLQEMQIGATRVEALRAMADRAHVAEVQAFAAAVVQATELGIPIADVLREQAKEMRVRRRQLAEEKAQKVPVKILFPVICCILPALFVVVIGPGALNIMRAFSQ